MYPYEKRHTSNERDKGVSALPKVHTHKVSRVLKILVWKFSIMFFKQFIPRWELRKQNPYGVQLFLLIFYIELLSRKVFWCFKNTNIYPHFWKPEIALLWWVGGWVGYDILPPSILFFFKYDNKQHKPVPKMCLKIASVF